MSHFVILHYLNTDWSALNVSDFCKAEALLLVKGGITVHDEPTLIVKNDQMLSVIKICPFFPLAVVGCKDAQHTDNKICQFRYEPL